jgi:diguanylate cyclase (GGDEF)-like protein
MIQASETCRSVLRHCAMTLVVLAGLLALSVAAYAAAPKPIEIGNETDRREITSSGDLYEGRGDTLQVETAIGADGATGRMSVRATTTGTSPNWFVFALRNSSEKPVERLLVTERYEHAGSGIVWPNLDARRIDNITPSLGFVPERLPFDNADAFRITIEPGQTVTFAAELVGDRVPRIQLWRSVDYEKRVRNKQLFHGILLGIVGLLALFLASIFVANHQAIFPSSALFAWMVLAYLCVDFGFWNKLFSIRPEENAVYRAAGEAGMSASMLVFTYTFLRIGRWHGFIRMLAGLAILSQLALIALAFLDPRLAATFARLSFAAVLAISALATLYLVLRGQDRALAVLPTWILFAVWLFAAALVLSGRLQSDVVVNGVVAGLVLLVVLMGFTVTQFAFRSIEPMLVGSPDDQQLRALAIDATGAAVFEWGAKRDEVRVGPLVDATLGLPAKERRESLPRFAERVHPSDREKLVQSLSALKGRNGGSLRLDFRMLHTDGSDRWFALEGSTVAVQDSRLARCVGLIRDITDQRREHERLMVNAVRDGTTFLPNRSLLLDRLDVGIARAKQEALVRPTVFYIDVDPSKSVSAAHVGEAVIVSMARKFQRLVRPGDVVGRLAADQFALVMMQLLDPREQRLVAEDLRNAIKSGMNISGQDVILTGSIGIATYDPQSPHGRAADLLSDAEIAMQRARRSGPDQIEVFSPAARADKDQRANMEQDLLAAMERKQVQVLFQPVMYLRTGMLAGFEAVARWEHPKLGPLDPAEFTPLDESTMFASRLGGYILRAAAAEAQRWNDEHPRPEAPIFVSINVARRQLFGDDLVKQVRSVMAAGLPKGALRIDVTEALVLDNPEQSTSLLRDLTHAGARLSLDDFGAGYSSFSFIGAFSFDSIKLDSAFLHGAGEGRAGTAMLRSLVALAHELGKTVTAKGADDETDLGLLRTVGCDYAQGSVSAGRAVPAREAMAMVRLLRKSERRLKRTGLFRLRNRRIDDEADKLVETRPAANSANPSQRAADTAPPNSVTPATMPPVNQSGAAHQNAIAAQATGLRDAVRTTSRPRPVAAPAPQLAASQPTAKQPTAQPMQDRAPTRQAQPSAPALSQAPLFAGQPTRPLAQPPAKQPPPMPQIQMQGAPAQSAPVPQAPAPKLPVLPHPLPAAAALSALTTAMAGTAVQPAAAAQLPLGQPIDRVSVPPLSQATYVEPPLERPRDQNARLTTPPPLPAATPAPTRVAPPSPPPSTDVPSSMVDRTLARLQAEIARSMSDSPPAKEPDVAPPANPVVSGASTPLPPASPPDVSSLPPALAESLARLAGRATERKPKIEPPPAAASAIKG